MLTQKEEDEIVDKLSRLTPMEYSQLMKKVNREKWEIMGLKGYNFRGGYPYPKQKEQ